MTYYIEMPDSFAVYLFKGHDAKRLHKETFEYWKSEGLNVREIEHDRAVELLDEYGYTSHWGRM